MITPFRARRAGLQSRLWREAARAFFQHVANPTLPVEVRRRRLECVSRFNWLPSGTHVDPVVAGGVPAEWVVPPGVRSDAVLLYLHGGGYAIGSPASHRTLVAHLAQAAGMRALVPHYRLGPEHHFPCALHDSVAAYRWLRNHGRVDPSRVVVAGDSAGGGLTVALAVAARDAGEQMPAALACLSPWTDLTCTGESMRTRAQFDPCYRPESLRLAARGYLGDADPMHPLASPLYADLRELPPLLIQVGEDEILLDDARSLVERAYSAGVDATLEVWPGLWHVFQTMLVMPEARRAIERLARFLSREHRNRTDDLNRDVCE